MCASFGSNLLGSERWRGHAYSQEKEEVGKEWKKEKVCFCEKVCFAKEKTKIKGGEGGRGVFAGSLQSSDQKTMVVTACKRQCARLQKEAGVKA